MSIFQESSVQIVVNGDADKCYKLNIDNNVIDCIIGLKLLLCIGMQLTEILRLSLINLSFENVCQFSESLF